MESGHGRVIAAIEDSRLLTDADLDELAESCLVHDYVISYRLAWVSPQRLEIDVRAGTSRWPVLKLALPSPLRPGWVSDLIVGVLAAEHLAELVGRVECRTPPPTGNASPRRR